MWIGLYIHKGSSFLSLACYEISLLNMGRIKSKCIYLSSTCQNFKLCDAKNYVLHNRELPRKYPIAYNVAYMISMNST